MRRQAFLLVIYRVPARPTAARVAVWRQLKKLGAVYLQQSVCAFPESAKIRRALFPALAKIEESGGTYYLLPLRNLPDEEWAKLVHDFRAQTSKHYEEIVENCEVNFQKEIQFETFRKNFTYEEAEEIRSDYDKIVAWLDRVRGRDLFDAFGRAEAEEWIRRCEKLLEAFELRVYGVHRARQLGHSDVSPGIVVDDHAALWTPSLAEEPKEEVKGIRVGRPMVSRANSGA